MGRDRRSHTPTPRESVNIPELPFCISSNLSRNARPCHARLSPLIPFPASPRTKNATPNRTTGNLVSLGALGALGDTSLEAVQEAAVDSAQGAHAAGAGGLAALGLLTPVVCSKKKVRKPSCSNNCMHLDIKSKDNALLPISVFESPSLRRGYAYTCGS